jgi:hypothetical protein
MQAAAIRFMGRPERIFISVDERTGRSTLSFAPADVSGPVVNEADAAGQQAMVTAREIAATYSGCAIVGPHFHSSPPPGKPARKRRR